MFDKFKKGDYILIQSSVGMGAGNFEINQIISVTPNNMELVFPLVHDYHDDFNNKSQVIQVPQHSKVILENDKTLFIKEQKNGLGGIIALMSNSGFSIKGYIADKSSKKVDPKDKSKVSKSKSGVICVLANYSGDLVRKVADFKFTNKYPTLTIQNDKKILVNNIKKEFSIGKWQHITVPPDLNLHLTDEKKAKKDYLFFKPRKKLFNKVGFLRKKYVKLFSITNPPIDECPIFTNKKYEQCLMIALSKMKHWNNHTHFTFELYAIKNEKVKIPKNNHSEGDLGVIHPFQVSYSDQLSEDHIEYWLQPFIIANHEDKKSISIDFGEQFICQEK